MARSMFVEEPSQGEPVSETVVSALAKLTDSDPLSLEPLYMAVDPDALNRLFEHDQTTFDRSPNRVEFTYCDCDVVVTADGDARVSKHEQEIMKVEEWM